MRYNLSAGRLSLQMNSSADQRPLAKMLCKVSHALRPRVAMFRAV